MECCWRSKRIESEEVMRHVQREALTYTIEIEEYIHVRETYRDKELIIRRYTSTIISTSIIAIV